MTAIKFGLALLAVWLLTLPSACGGDDNHISPTPTTSQSETPTPTITTPTTQPEPTAPRLPIRQYPALYSPEQIWTAPANDGQPTLVLEGTAPAAVAWSPDGQTLAMAPYSSGNARLWLIASGQPGPGIEFPGQVSDLLWSVDGRVLAVVYGTGKRAMLATIDRSGARHDLDEVTFTESSYQSFKLAGWLPDGRLLANNYTSGGGHIFAYDLSSADKALVSEAVVPADQPALSPDATLLALVTSSGDLGCGTDGVQLVDLVHGGFRQPVNGVCSIISAPVWSPDGRRLAFGALGRSQTEAGAYVVDLNGGTPIQLTRSIDTPIRWRDSQTLFAGRHGCYGCEGPPPKLVTIDMLGRSTELAGHIINALSPDGLELATVDEDGAHVRNLGSESCTADTTGRH